MEQVVFENEKQIKDPDVLLRTVLTPAHADKYLQLHNEKYDAGEESLMRKEFKQKSCLVSLTLKGEKKE